MLLGPGTPHYALYLSYPQHSVTVHFLPILLFEMGPEGDGARILSRFTAPPDHRRAGPPLPRPLTEKMAQRFGQMAAEFEGPRTGSELRLRALLMETLVDLLRWEESTGSVLGKSPATLDWLQVEKTLRYMHEHYAEPLYIEQIARSVGMSVSRLQVTFRQALGMSCVHYLRALRISHARPSSAPRRPA